MGFSCSNFCLIGFFLMGDGHDKLLVTKLPTVDWKTQEQK